MTNAIVAALTALAAAQPLPAAPRTLYLRAGRMLDVREGRLLGDRFITIRGDRIAGVAPAAEVRLPEGAAVIDLSRFTVLPGLIDCHVHLSARTDRPDRFAEIWEFKDTP